MTHEVCHNNHEAFVVGNKQIKSDAFAWEFIVPLEQPRLLLTKAFWFV